MKPKDFDQYIKYMKQSNVEVIPSINKSNQLQGFRFAYKGQNLKGSELTPCSRLICSTRFTVVELLKDLCDLCG